MSGLQALVTGLRAARRGWRLVVFAWAADLAVAALVAAPFVAALDRASATRDIPAAGLDGRFLQDFAARAGGLYAFADLKLALVTLVAVLVHATLAGGLIGRLGGCGAPGEPAPGGLRPFLGACADRAGRMIAISVLAAALLALAGWLLHEVVAGRLEETVRSLSSERRRFALQLAPGIAYLLLIAVTALWADLARAHAALAELSVARALRAGLRTLWRRKGAVLTAAGLGLALQVAAIAVYAGLDARLDQTRWPGIVGVIALGQLLMLWRHGVRAGVIAGEARLCRAEPAVEAAREDEPRAEGEVAASDPA